MTLTLPRLGETMEEARVTAWLIAPGDTFRRGDVLLEAETDKTVVEVPAMQDGVLVAQLVGPGDTVALDHPIAEVEVAGAADTPRAPVAAATPAPVPSVDPQPTLPPSTRTAASPAARAAARRMGVDLTLVPGTGRRGRVTGADVTARGGGSETVPIVLLHGLFDDSRGWRDLPRRLAQAGQTVLPLDLPGHGANTTAAETIDAAVDSVATLLPEGPVRLVGHSMGGAIAARLALRLGGRVRHLILLSPAGIGARINADFIDGMLAAETTAALARALALLDAGPVSASALDDELASLRARRDGHRAMAASLARDGFQQIDITPDLSALACPVTVVVGTADRILDWHDVANLPAAAAVHLVRGAGHLPHAAAPDLVAALVTASATHSGANLRH